MRLHAADGGGVTAIMFRIEWANRGCTTVVGMARTKADRWHREGGIRHAVKVHGFAVEKRKPTNTNTNSS